MSLNIPIYFDKVLLIRQWHIYCLGSSVCSHLLAHCSLLLLSVINQSHLAKGCGLIVRFV